tara:strand:+ start:253 stop:861 length:609 start_codon:yes stop_codon:yes gene_type:complete
MISIDYFMSHGSPWTFLGHSRLGDLVNKFNAKLNIYPVNYGEIFPISGGLPVSKRPPQRQKLRLQELNRWSKFLNINLNTQPNFFPSKSLLPSLIIIAAKMEKLDNYFELAFKIMNSLWVENQDIDDEDVLKKILNRMNFDAENIILLAKSEKCLDIMNKYTQLAITKNVFGAPTYIIEDQIYWGQDRLDFVERHLNTINMD